MSIEKIKNKLRHIKIFMSLFEQKSILIGQHSILQIEKNSRELYKMTGSEAEGNENKENKLGEKAGWLL